MKHNKLKKYGYFQTKLLLFGLGMAAFACVGTCVIYTGIWQGRGGDWLVRVMHDLLGLSWSRAHYIYQMVFRNYSSTWMLVCTVVLFFFFFGYYLHWITKKLEKLEQGIDDLLSREGKEISLPPEFSYLEGKLNTVRQTLEKRTLEARLSEQRKNDLVMYLAHDIRTPLTSVIGYLNLLEEAPEMPPELRARYTHITLEKANRLEHLVEEFFEITRFNFGRIPLQKEQLDLYYMLVQLTEEFYPIAKKKGNTITLQAREDVSVCADPMKLARVFNNILKNAASYAAPDSEIQVGAYTQGDAVRVYVKNHGPTIPQEKLDTIFERFYRLEDARTTQRGGAGLGLAIAKEIVTLHGGTIQAESGQGITTFTVTLPLTERSSV